MDDAARNSVELRGNQGQRCRVGELHLAFAVEKDVVKERARRRNPEKKARRGGTHATAAEGVDATTSAWTSEEIDRVLGQDPPGEDEKSHEGLVSAAKSRKLAAWRNARYVNQ